MNMQTKVRRGMTLVFAVLVLAIPGIAHATFDSGSNGHDGVLNPTANLVIDMADHPDGIYQYVSVNIPTGVTVSFKPNSANTPVTWLIQESCTVAGAVAISGMNLADRNATIGGPGGYGGGRGPLGAGAEMPEAGQGPGGGRVSSELLGGGNASFGTAGEAMGSQSAAGDTYGNDFLLPLIGGSGGAGGRFLFEAGHPYAAGGAGGGGAILLVASGEITISGSITATGGSTTQNFSGGGAGSGGAIRLVGTSLRGTGYLNTSGGTCWPPYPYWPNDAGQGRIRIEAFSDNFTGGCTGVVTRGMQNVLFLPSNVTPHLSITQVAGISIPVTPSGSVTSPDVILPGELTGPMTVVVHAENIPINTPITVDVKPYSGASVSGTAQNIGTLDSSTATVSLDIPRGGGSITARAVTAVNPGKSGDGQPQSVSYRDTGLTTDGERFKTAEVSTTLGGPNQVVFVTESGKRVSLRSK